MREILRKLIEKHYAINRDIPWIFFYVSHNISRCLSPLNEQHQKTTSGNTLTRMCISKPKKYACNFRITDVNTKCFMNVTEKEKKSNLLIWSFLHRAS